MLLMLLCYVYKLKYKFFMNLILQFLFEKFYELIIIIYSMYLISK